jgi:Zn-dependent peptidase ImmA (M78 family)
MAVDDLRAAEIRRVFQQQAERYPVLLQRPGYQDLAVICNREGIIVVHDDRLPTAGALVKFLDIWTIFLSSKLAWSLAAPTMMHELAHRWCHADEPLFTNVPFDVDPREEEADYFVSLVYGPHYLVFPVADLVPDERGRFLAAS